MYVVRCDRCGTETHLKSLLPQYGKDTGHHLMKYNIFKNEDDGVREINLCEDCQLDFENFLDEKKTVIVEEGDQMIYTR